jgi:type VI secretion system protein ImpA
MDPVVAGLAQPVSSDNPAGADLEDTQLLASFDGYRVFGQMTAPGDETDWRDIRDKATDALGQSRDLRLLAHLAAASLRLGGLSAFCDVIGVAGQWFQAFPDALYPRVDEDAILRKNALNGFADRMAIVDSVRRQPIVSNPQLGAFSLRHFEIAKGRLQPAESDGQPISEAQIAGAMAAATSEQLAPLEAALGTAIDALQQIDNGMKSSQGYEAGPDFGPLLEPLQQMRKILADELSARQPNAATGEGAAGEPAGAVIGVGSIKSRDDAIRALDAVSAFFRKNEPSSPVPIFVERAKRLVAKDFLEVLKDVAPDGLDQAKRVGGIRDDE